jgi:hypothetical protein
MMTSSNAGTSVTTVTKKANSPQSLRKSTAILLLKKEKHWLHAQSKMVASCSKPWTLCARPSVGNGQVLSHVLPSITHVLMRTLPPENTTVSGSVPIKPSAPNKIGANLKLVLLKSQRWVDSVNSVSPSNLITPHQSSPLTLTCADVSPTREKTRTSVKATQPLPTEHSTVPSHLSQTITLVISIKADVIGVQERSQSVTQRPSLTLTSTLN